jgi:hypothetical protein
MDGKSIVKLHLPFVTKEEIDLRKIGDELIIRIGNFKKNIVLPRAYALLEPRGARLEEDHLLIEFGGSSERDQEGGERKGDKEAWDLLLSLLPFRQNDEGGEGTIQWLLHPPTTSENWGSSSF